MKAQDIKQGLRVIYATKDTGGDKKDNPLWGGDYGHVVGTIVGTNREKDYWVKVEWDNGTKNQYKAMNLEIYDEADEVGKVKAYAQSFLDFIKPYQKYVGLFALAAVVDHFFLGGQFANRFKRMGEGLVGRMMDGIDAVVDKLNLGPKS